MKTLLCALLFGGICLAEDEFPKHARVSIQYIEIPHAALTDLLGDGKSGAAIHEEALAMAKSGEAKILETCMVVSYSGYKGRVLSALQEIYPTEYSPPGFEPPKDFKNINPPIRGVTAFETRIAGITMEFEATIAFNNTMVDLRLLPEYVRRLRLETMMEYKDEWGDASLRMPIYETWSANTSLVLQSGKSELVSVITPAEQPAAAAPSRRVLLFVRADVIATLQKP